MEPRYASWWRGKAALLHFPRIPSFLELQHAFYRHIRIRIDLAGRRHPVRGTRCQCSNHPHHLHQCGERLPAGHAADLGGLRFRPLGIFNNKPESIYISCSLDTEFVGDQATTELRPFFNNTTGSSVEVTCTAQGGNRQSGVNNYPGSVIVAPNSTSSISFFAIDKVSASYTTINLSCLLPSGVEMGTIRLSEQDAGDGL